MSALSTRSRTIRVAIVDDHAVVREGIARIIDAAPDMVLTKTYTSGDAFLQALPTNPVDVCLLDMIMDGTDGLEVLAQLRDSGAHVATLVFTIHTEESFGVQCIKAGASGFLSKGSAPSQILDAIRHVRQGHLFASPALAARLAGADGAAGTPHAGLSHREFEVFVRIAAGRRNSEISRELGIDQRTVSSYRRRVLTKLGVERDADIVRYALEHHILGPAGVMPDGPRVSA